MSAETLADILAEMRDADGDFTDREVVDYADRIEAAAEREREIADAMLACRGKMFPHPDPEHAPPPHPAASAAMRAALEKIVRIAEEWDTPGIHAVQTTLYRILEAARAALAAPPRNCDVGTAEEQGIRCLATMRYWRKTYEGDALITAIMKWAQMPYEAEGGVE